MIKQDNASYMQGHAYDEEGDISVNFQLERIMHYLRDFSDKSILELGLGNGKMLDKIEDCFSKVTCIEGSSELINDYKEKHPFSKATIFDSYFEDFYTNEKYDVVHMGFVLEHVDNPQSIIGKFIKYVKAGGYMFISVPNAESLHRRVGYAAGLLDDVHLLSETDHRVGHLRYYDKETFTRDIETALKNNDCYGGVKLEGIYLKPLTTSQMQSLNLSNQIIDAFCKVGIDYPELSNAMLAIIKR